MNDKNNDPKSKSLLERLLDHIVNNPFITLWSVALMIGGLVGFIHYARLGHIPEIAPEVAATILIAVALAGTFVTLMIAVFFTAPAFYLRMILTGKDTLPNSGNDPAQQAKIAEGRRGVVFAVRSALIAAGLWCVLIWGIGASDDEQMRQWTGLAGLGLLLVSFLSPVIFSRRLIRRRSLRPQPDPARPQSGERSFFDYVLAIAAWFALLGLAGLLLGPAVFDNKALSTTEKVLSLIGFLSIVILSNAILAPPSLVQGKRNAPLVLLLFAAAPVTVFLVLPENPVSVEKITFNQLGLGSMKNSIFLVRADACAAINVIRENSCITLKPNAESKTQTDTPPLGCVRPDSLENRIGSEFLLVYDVTPVAQSSGKKNKNPSLLIPLKKDDVVLWAFGNTATAGLAACSDEMTAGAPAP